MTNEETIAVLKANYPDACYSDLRRAVDMAIDALDNRMPIEPFIEAPKREGLMNIKENFDKIIEGTEVDIGVPMTPGRWKKGSQESKDVMLITVTCGGGLGGSKWNEVVIDDQIPAWPDEKGGLYTLTRINGQRFLLNPKYIVKVEFVSIVSAVFVNGNSNYPLGEWKYSWPVRRGAKVNFIPEYMYKVGG